MTEGQPKATPATVRKQNLNYVGETENDLQAFMVQPQDGRGAIGEDLDDMYNIKIQERDSEGRTQMVERSGWNLKTAITSDGRLANFNSSQEIYVQWTYRAEGLCLLKGFKKSAMLASWKRSSIVEPSLGRNMALRQNLQTIHNKSETVNIEENTKPRTILGFPIGKGR